MRSPLGQVLGHAARAVTDGAAHGMEALNNVEQSLGTRQATAVLAGRDAKHAAGATLSTADHDADEAKALDNMAALGKAQPHLGPAGNPILGLAANLALEAARTPGAIARNALRRGALETAVDPVTYVPGADVFSVAGRAARTVNRATKGVEEASKARALARAAAQKDPFAEAPASTLATKVGDVVAKPLSGLRDAANRTLDLGVAGRELRRKTAPGVAEEIHGAQNEAHTIATRDRKAIDDLFADDGLRAHIDGAVAGGRAALPPELRHALQRDAWLNGTQAVRKAALADGFKPSDVELRAPVLNLQTAYRKDYLPHQHLADDDTVPEVVTRTGDYGFNKAQTGPGGDVPLSERIQNRLSAGWTARHRNVDHGDLFMQRFVAKHLGLEDRPETALLRAAIDAEHAKAAPDPARIAALTKRLTARTAAQGAFDDKALHLLSPEGLNDARGAEVGSPAFASKKLLPNATNDAALSAELAPVAKHLGLDPKAAMDLNAAVRGERGRFDTTTYLGNQILKRQDYDTGKNLLSGLSDLSRKALFAIPFAHMKNIAEAQYMGPGGAQALAHGAALAAARGVPSDAMVKLGMLPGAKGVYEKLAGQQIGDAEWEKRLDGLRRKGALVEFADDAHGPNAGANRALWTFDAAQRVALDDFLAKHHPGYHDLSPYQQGAMVNAALFDYYHQSDLAKTLRTLGAPFPHWRLSVMERDARQLLGDKNAAVPAHAGDPTRFIAYMRGMHALNHSLFPADASGKRAEGAYDVDLSGPMDEGPQQMLAPVSSLASILGPLGMALHGKATAQDVVQGGGDALGGILGSYVPYGGAAPEVLDAIGHATGNKSVRGDAAALGADRFHSTAPPELRALLSVIAGGYTKADPSSYLRAVRTLKERYGLSEYDAEAMIRRGDYHRSR